jgi:demethylmenaquinone methyltransferase / 2-methoxy-6-polyprenyl-1,4-benzoquinol methylase
MRKIQIPQNPAERSQYVQGMFNSISRTYDLLNTLTSLKIDEIWRRKLVRISEVPAGGKVLDLCTGTGRVVFDFAKFSPAEEITGLDFSSQMLGIAKQELVKMQKQMGSKKINFILGDVTQMPFEDNSFDVISSAFGLRNVVSPEKYFIEKYRVTKPGGKSLTLELTRPTNVLIRGLYYPYLHFYLPMLGRVLSGDPDAYSYLAKTISEFFTPDEVLGFMRNAGWKNVKAIPMTSEITTIFYGIK